MIIVKGFIRDASPSFKLIIVINTKDPIFTPSNIAAVILDFLNFGIRGLIAQTTKNEGINIPMVAKIAPGIPFNKYPIKVAVVNTGPGVNCPMATASNNCSIVNNPYLSINSASKNANNTYPLPYNTAPIFKKIRNSKDKGITDTE